MASLKGTETEKNLMKAFAGESAARNRYTYYASKAKKEGYEQVAFIFDETANQEKEHAQRLFRLMEGASPEVQVTVQLPEGPEKDTHANLIDSAAGENHEHSHMYPEFAEVARKEGFPEIARVMEMIAVAEKAHEERYLALAANIKDGKVFRKDTKVVWRCRNCGYTIESASAPAKCPACDHAQAYFEIAAINW
ncbi:rubrerythrin [Alphaproteobacteria bacterium]|nr:rubrerythrin [Alphaproteobacteria bacterium]